jgi:hypothetical protein
MASQLSQWLTDEVQLSRSVRDFEGEFANGYLIGEVLAKHNQQPDFFEDKFRDDGRADTKVNNFSRIEPTLRRLGVPFDSRRAEDVMKAKHGSALSLLYEIRVALAPLNKVAVSGKAPPSGGIRAARLSLRASAPQFTSTESQLFSKAVRAKAENQNELFMKRHLRNFGRGVERLWAQRDAMARAREDAHSAALNQQRLRQLHLLRTNRMLRAAKEEHGVREWQRNMEIRLAQTMRTQRYDHRRKLAKEESVQVADEDAAAELQEGVAYFATATAKLGIETEAPPKPFPGSVEDEARLLLQVARGGATHVPPLMATQGLGREEYYEVLEDRLGSQEAARASAAAILKRLQRRKQETAELLDKRGRRRAAFVSAAASLRASRLGAERLQWIASSLRSRGECEAAVDSECASITRLEGGMRLRRAKLDEAQAVEKLRGETAALRWDAQVWGKAREAHADEAGHAVQDIVALRKQRQASRLQDVTRMARGVLDSVVDAAMSLALVRENGSQLGRCGDGWEIAVQGGDGSAAWQGSKGTPQQWWRWNRLALVLQADPAVAAVTLPLLRAPSESSHYETLLASTMLFLKRLGSSTSAGSAQWHDWQSRPEDVLIVADREHPQVNAARLRLALRASLIHDIVHGQGEWFGLDDGHAEAARLDAFQRDLIASLAPSEEDTKGGKKKPAAEKKKGGKEAEELTNEQLLEIAEKHVLSPKEGGEALDPRAVLGICVKHLQDAVAAPHVQHSGLPGLPAGLPLTAALLGPPYAPLVALALRLSAAFGMRSIDPWALLAEARLLAASADEELVVEQVDDVGAEGVAQAKHSSRLASDRLRRLRGLPPRPVSADERKRGMGSMAPVEDELDLAGVLSGGDPVLTVAAENTDSAHDGYIRDLCHGCIPGDGCSLGPDWVEELQSLGQRSLEEQGEATLYSPSTSLLVDVVVLALRALAKEVSPDGWGAESVSAAESIGIRGWILVGFPRTPEQASLLEHALTGWTPRETHVDSLEARAAAAVQASHWFELAAPLPSDAVLPKPRDAWKQHSPRGISAVLRLDTDSFRAARYAMGWRWDQEAPSPRTATGSVASLPSAQPTPAKATVVAVPGVRVDLLDSTAVTPVNDEAPPSARRTPSAVSRAGPDPWAWSPRTEGGEGHERAPLSSFSQLADGYIPTVREGPPLFHADLLPPSYAMDHKATLRRTAMAEAASRRFASCVQAREAAGAEARVDEWFERCGALRVVRWSKPGLEAAAGDELARAEGAAESSRVRDRHRLARKTLEWASLDRSEQDVACDADFAPRMSHELVWTVAVGRQGESVPASAAWPEYAVAVSGSLWAMDGRDLLLDHEMFAVTARAFSHAFVAAARRASASHAACAASERQAAQWASAHRQRMVDRFVAREGMWGWVKEEAVANQPSSSSADESDSKEAEAAISGAMDDVSDSKEAEAAISGAMDDVSDSKEAETVSKFLQPALLPAWMAPEVEAAPWDEQSPLALKEAHDSDAGRLLVQLSTPLADRISTYVSPASNSTSQHVVHLVRAASSAVLERWTATVKAFGETVECHSSRLHLERSGAVAHLSDSCERLRQDLSRPFSGYNEAIDRVQALIGAVPHELRPLPATKEQLGKDVASVCRGMRSLAGRRHALAKQHVEAWSVDGWLQVVQWSVMLSTASLVQAECKRFTGAYHMLLDANALVSGAVPAGLAPLNAETVFLEQCLLACGVSPAQIEDWKASEVAPEPSSAAKTDKKPADKKAPSKKGDKKAKDEDSGSSVGSAAVGVPAALQLAKRSGALAPWRAADAPVPPFGVGELSVEGASDSSDSLENEDEVLGALAAAAGDDEETLEAWIQSRAGRYTWQRSWATVEQASKQLRTGEGEALSRGDGAALGSMLKEALGKALNRDPHSPPAALPRKIAKAVQLLVGDVPAEGSDAPAPEGGDPAVRTAEARSSVLFGKAVSEIAQLVVASIVWDAGRRVRAGERLGKALSAAEAARESVRAALEATVAEEIAEAEAAAAEAADGKKVKDKKKEAKKKGGDEVGDEASVLAPLVGLVPAIPADHRISLVAAAGFGRIAPEMAPSGEEEAPADIPRLLREISAARAAAEALASARLDPAVLDALHHEARVTARRIRTHERFAVRLTEQLQAMHSLAVAQCNSIVDSRLRAELEAVASVEAKLLTDVQAGRPPAWPLRVCFRTQNQSEGAVSVVGVGGKVSEATQDWQVKVSVVEQRHGLPLPAARRPATETAPPVESCNPLAMTPSAFGLLTSVLHSLAADKGNAPILASSTESAGSHAWEALGAFHDSVPVKQVAFSVDGSPVDDAAELTTAPVVAEATETASSHTAEAGAVIVKAGEWVKADDVMDCLRRLALSGKLGQAWQRQAQTGWRERVGPLVSACNVSAEHWGGRDGRVQDVPVAGWIDWRVLSTALACSMGAEDGVRSSLPHATPALRDHVQVAGWESAEVLAPALEALRKSRLHADAGGIPRWPSTEELMATARSFGPPDGTDEATLVELLHRDNVSDLGQFSKPVTECSHVRFWFDRLFLRTDEANVAEAAAALNAEQERENTEGSGTPSHALPPASLKAVRDAEQPHADDGLGGWHHQPQSHATRLSHHAAERAKEATAASRQIQAIAAAERSGSDAEEHASADHAAIRFAKDLLSVWSDEAGDVMWMRMLSTVRRLRDGFHIGSAPPHPPTKSVSPEEGDDETALLRELSKLRDDEEASESLAPDTEWAEAYPASFEATDAPKSLRHVAQALCGHSLASGMADDSKGKGKKGKK